MDTFTLPFSDISMPNQQSIPISIADFPLSGAQMKLMLKLCGVSMSDFATFIRRSPSYVSATLGRRDKILPLRRIRQFLDFLGEENFCEAYKQVTSGETRKVLPVKLLRPILKHCGFTTSHFCRFIGKSPAFFLDNSSAFRTSLPLSLIDKLKEFLGDQEYAIAVQEALRREQLRP